MGEENNIFGKFGKSEILLSLKGAPTRPPVYSIIEDSIEFDRATMRKEALSNPMKIPPILVDVNLKNMEREYLELFEKKWLEATMDKGDAIREISIMIEGEPCINRPKNLKYPNKKRAKRIWKKWRNRFGVTPSKRAVIPKATLSVIPVFRNNQAYYDIEAVVEKGELR